MIEISDYIDGTKFESIADYGFGDQYTNFEEINIDKLHNFLKSFDGNRTPLIYCDSDRIRIFFEIFKNYSDFEFNLISHNGDDTFDQEFVDNKPLCIKKWFGQNLNVVNTPDLVSLPIGLERPHWSTNRYGSYGFKHNKLYEYSNYNYEKNNLCYINFNPSTNRNKRQWVINHFQSESWCKIRLGGIQGNLDSYFRDCKESHFVICPDGNGIDCHRNWEMLYLGVTPILEKSQFHINIYSDLPVLIVDSFTDLTENFLMNNINNQNQYYKLEKLNFSYWKNLIINNRT